MPKLALINRNKLTLRRLAACAGAFLGMLVLAMIVFGSAILNGYGKRAAERAFAEAHPGFVLRIGKLDYSVGANRLVARFVTLSASNTTLKVDRISLWGVRWSRLIWGTATLPDVLAKARIGVTNMDLEFPQAHYGIRCAWLSASVPDSELIAQGAELRTLVGDAEFFAAHDYRTARFHLVAPECRVLGLSFGELFEGKSYRARSVHISGPSFEALVNCDKPVKPFMKSPLMVHEALAAIRQPLQIGTLTITNGSLKYGEQFVAGADPGVLTISGVSLSAEGIANRGEVSAAIVLRAQGNLMDTGMGKLLMTIPITPADFSLHYSGSLSAMDLSCLNPFLALDQHTRITSGNAQEATFEIDVIAGQARGHVRAIYRNLEIAVLDKRTDTEKGFDNRVASFLANALKIRSSNIPDASGLMKEGEVKYTRRPDDEFQQFAWFALRTGILDVIYH
jgi:hypothetical protein